MRILRWCNWFDAARHREVEQELEESERELVDMTVRLVRLEAEIESFYSPVSDRRRQADG